MLVGGTLVIVLFGLVIVGAAIALLRDWHGIPTWTYRFLVNQPLIGGTIRRWDSGAIGAAWLRTSLNGHTAARAWARHATSRLPRTNGGTMTPPEPPDRILYDLEEALELLAALEDALEVVAESDYLGVVAEVETEVSRLHRKLGFDRRSGGEDGR